jgi:branched-chain amino acid transport system permease protein
MDYFLSIAIYGLIILILAQGLNITFGLGRIFNLAHLAIYLVAAYSTAIAITHGISFIWGVLIGIVLCSLIAWFMGKISLRISGDYFAIATLALHQVIISIAFNWTSLTRGALGIHKVIPPFGIKTYEEYIVLVIIVAVIAMAFLYLFFRSKTARSLRAIGENTLAAQSLGRNSNGIKDKSFVLGSIYAALAAPLMVMFLQYVDPNFATIHDIVFIVTIVILGKLGSYWGVTLATAVLVILPEPMRFLTFLPSVYIGPMRQILYAAILFIMVYWKRETLFPKIRNI